MDCLLVLEPQSTRVPSMGPRYQQSETCQHAKPLLQASCHIHARTPQLRHVRDRQAAEAEAEAHDTARVAAHWAHLEAGAAETEARERERLQRLADEVKEFNRLKLLEISEAERRERCARRAHCALCCLLSGWGVGRGAKGRVVP
jgi:hypothetical protein